MTAMVTPTVTDYELSADLSELFMRASEDHAISFSAERLRAACKCAHCVRARIDERFPARFPGIAIVGITDEGAEIMKEYKGSPALDAGLLAAAQAVEHYEISRYGTLIAWAEELGLDQSADLLRETLEEEKATDEALTEIAKTAINQEAEAA